MTKKIFHVVGTDTNIGKTYACCQLVKHLNISGILSNALKPIATGIVGSVNPDVKEIMDVNSYPLENEVINPFCFKPAIAPHIAASIDGTKLTVNELITHLHSSFESLANSYVFIEGVGGVMVPLNESETYLDLLQKMSEPIILIVGIKLGCLNHALLTLNALKQRNLNVIGWIANCLDANMPYKKENIEYLKNSLNVPCLAEINYGGNLIATTKFSELVI
ncbi:MAG: dethiobiotin synthase [Burkholderiales bacterium]|nr:dethiobiotin synthase [Burkholderiales bacterium]